MKEIGNVIDKIWELNEKRLAGDAAASAQMESLAWVADIPTDLAKLLVIPASVRIRLDEADRLKEENRRLAADYDNLQNDYIAMETQIDMTQLSARPDQDNQDYKELAEHCMSELDATKKELTELTAKSEALEAALKQKRDQQCDDCETLVRSGRISNYYPREEYELVMDVLKSSLQNMQSGTRRYEVISKVIEANETIGLPKLNAAKVKSLFSDYRKWDSKLESDLGKLGIEAEHGGKHIALRLGGDDRYKTTVSVTTSDVRAGANTASHIIKTMF